MSVHLDDELFDESPGIVCVVLTHAIEDAGWRLMHVSERGDRLVWEVRDHGLRAEVLEAVIRPEGAGARVRVRTLRGPEPVEGGVVDDLRPSARVIDLHPRVQPPFGPDLT